MRCRGPGRWVPAVREGRKPHICHASRFLIRPGSTITVRLNANITYTFLEEFADCHPNCVRPRTVQKVVRAGVDLQVFKIAAAASTERC